ncbi:conserved Plasmodium protein, unknown function [Plasmodium yoelii]|uniref:Uncharacterized protein n=3 Tax=Plasmodium yoelii TaxID=5861 RepID=A0AAE9WU83_PLAYO|nr:conserved Plasmodium protein, unknown function [Plasmodium yoelii]WBY60100.1 hypothetical protein Py17XNL_001303253 [Plasmodium yoelii yoelii]CDU20016.1 conserved Plasmodium protein, unknown function [Plasmodium yoelii]VTZ80774.1 conserved Plasmodium protein, unknown function [Plasmodium yoelii]|eukprot:XP_723887.2 conserved Plasmodium protein, unknown function [Plasmodium yoelii]
MKLHNNNCINENFRKNIGNYEAHYMHSNHQSKTINYNNNSKDVGGNIIIINEKNEKFCTNTNRILSGYNNVIDISNMEKCTEDLNNNNHIENNEKDIMNIHNINYIFNNTDSDRNFFVDCLDNICKNQDKMNGDDNNYDKKTNITIIDNKKDNDNDENKKGNDNNENKKDNDNDENKKDNDNNENKKNNDNDENKKDNDNNENKKDNDNNESKKDGDNDEDKKDNDSDESKKDGDNDEDICKNVYELKSDEHDVEISSASYISDNKIDMPEKCNGNTIENNNKEKLLNDEISAKKQKTVRILNNEIISTNLDDNKNNIFAPGYTMNPSVSIGDTQHNNNNKNNNKNKNIKCHEENKQKNCAKLEQRLKTKSHLDNNNLTVCGNLKIKDDDIKNTDSTTEDNTQKHNGVLHTIKKNVNSCETFQMINSRDNSILEKSSIIQTDTIDEENVNRVKIAYKEKIKDNNDIKNEYFNNENSDVYMLSIQENSNIGNNISNYSYSLNKKNIYNGNELEHKEIYYNKPLIGMKNSFKGPLNVPMPRLTSDQNFHKNNKLSSCKNEKNLFSSGILELNHEKNSENNLLSRNMLYSHNKVFNNIFPQNTNDNVDGLKYFDESQINQIDNQIKDKYFIKMSKIFSNSKDEYTKWVLQDEYMENTQTKDNKIDDSGNDKQISNLPNDLKENYNDVVKNEEIQCHVEISPNTYNNLKNGYSDKNTNTNTIIKDQINTKDIDEKDCEKSYFCCPIKEQTPVPNSTNSGLLNTIFRKILFKKNNKFMIKSKNGSNNLRKKLPNRNFHIPKKSLTLHAYSCGTKVKSTILFEKPRLKNENKKDNTSIQNIKDKFNNLTSLYSTAIDKKIIKNTPKKAKIYNKKHVNPYKYCEAMIYNNKGHHHVLNSMTNLHKAYPKCEIICRIPNKKINCIHYKKFPTPKRLITNPM